VTEQVTENVEQPTEEAVTEPASEKLFTQEDLNAAVGKAKARVRAKVEKEYRQKYGNLTNVLKAGTGKETVEEMTDTFQQFYQKKGIQIPQEPAYSEEDIALLAGAEARDIIDSGYDEVVEEVDRLAALGADHMSPREKALFKALAEHRQTAERGRELAAIGVTEDVYSSQEFKNFAGMFNPSTPITEVYKLYAKTVKPNVEPIGSMKNGSHDEGKTFYTPEEVDKLTPKDYDNPVIFQRVRDSMRLWK
jgi:hypothetical protein